MKKDDIITAIKNCATNAEIYEKYNHFYASVDAPEAIGARKDKHTWPRMINIWCSSFYCDQLVNMYNRVLRDELDAGFVQSNTLLWQKIADDFTNGS